MDNYQKFGLIAGQFLFGIIFGFIGALTPLLFRILYFDKSPSLFGDIMFAIIGGYIGIQTGIAFDGYQYLKRIDRKSDFIRFFCKVYVE